MRNALFILGKALCGVLLLQIAIKYIFLGPVGYVLQFVEKPAVLTASLLFFAGLVLFLQALGEIYDKFIENKQTTEKPKECKKKVAVDNLEPEIVVDNKNKHIKIIGDCKAEELKTALQETTEEWTVSGQHETYINLPKRNLEVNSVHYRIGEQNQNLPTESICE